MPAVSSSRVYLAGPEVFLPEARAVGEAKARLCAEAGLAGVFPLDQALDLAGKSPAEQASMIFRADEDLMRSCALCIANLTPFRGVSMDSGTAYEIGFMRALGRPVLGYTNVAADYAARAHAWRAARDTAQKQDLVPDADRPDVTVESFGLAENLMIACAVEAAGSRVAIHSAPPGEEMTDLTAFRACVAEAARLIGRRGDRLASLEP